MSARLGRRLGGLVMLAAASFVAAGQPREAPALPVVYSADVDSIIHPVSAEYMIQTMDQADRAGATLVIFTLRTPGGLVDSTRQIITHMLAARTPVAIFIGPSGTRAASAGFLLTIAADVAAMAPDIEELLRQLDGRTVMRFDGTPVVLRTAGARVVAIDMNWRQRLLSAIAHPNVAYILLSLGTLGLTIELWSPGAVLPGVAGGLCLLLAFFAFQILPVNYAGLLLILFGLLLLVLELKITSY